MGQYSKNTYKLFINTIDDDNQYVPYMMGGGDNCEFSDNGSSFICKVIRCLPWHTH